MRDGEKRLLKGAAGIGKGKASKEARPPRPPRPRGGGGGGGRGGGGSEGSEEEGGGRLTPPRPASAELDPGRIECRWTPSKAPSCVAPGACKIELLLGLGGREKFGSGSYR